MSGLTKLGLAPLLAFALSLLALAAELLYLLCHHRRKHRLPPPPAMDDPELPAAGPSKELVPLCFLCWKNQSRVEPTSSALPPVPSSSVPTRGWRTGALFTIREEEEEYEDEEEGRSHGSAAAEPASELTPFSTPCASPPFHTPPPSRPREAGVDVGISGGSGGGDFPPPEKKLAAD